MLRAFLISILFCLSVQANDIYVEQAEDTSQKTQVALQTQIPNNTFSQPVNGTNFEKSLVVPVGSKDYCSVVAGCAVKE
jgi:hypothetical protein